MTVQNIPPAREAVFRLLEDTSTVNEFFDHVADDVQWRLFGHHPLAGDYRGKSEFMPATIDTVRPLLRDRSLHFAIRGLYSAGSTVTVEMDGVATALDGIPYDPFYVWICWFAQDTDTITRAHAYIDTSVVTDILRRLSPNHRQG